MATINRDLRVLVSTANLGNARPDAASIAALIPDDGSFAEVVNNPRFPLPTPEQQRSLMEDIGFNTVLKRSSMQSQVNEVSNNNKDELSDNNKDEDGHFDIIVLGFQEATFDVEEDDAVASSRVIQPLIRKTAGMMKSRDYTKPNSIADWLDGGDSREIGELLQQRCPSYNFIVRFQRGEMRLEILTRENLEVDLLSLAAQNTGRGVNGIMNAANKGGIIAELLVDNSTRLSFCTTHLQAHEGREKYEDRCRMTSVILDGTTPDGPLNVDLTLRSHFTFFLGDLNFRTELPNSADLSTEEHIKKVRKLVKKKQWRELNLADELFKALRDKDCLVGFKTLPCFFPPTFKVERNGGLEFKDQRRPSYTDRILWRTLHKLEDRIKPMAYEPIIDFSTSDHKPVRGAFKIQLNDRIEPRLPITERKGLGVLMSSLFVSRSRLGGGGDSKLYLFVSNIKCDFRKRAMAPDPIVVFMSFPYNLVQQKVKKIAKVRDWIRSSMIAEVADCKKQKQERKDSRGFPRTKKLRATYTPAWLDEIDFVVETHDKDGKPFDLTGAIIFMVVIDRAPTLEDKVIGILPLNLAHLCMSTFTPGRPRLSNTSSEKSIWTSMKDVFTGNHACLMQNSETQDSEPFADNRLLNMKKPLTKNGKQTGWLSVTVDSKWLDDAEATAERTRRSAEGRRTSFRAMRQSILGRLTAVDEFAEVPSGSSSSTRSRSQRDARSGATRARGNPASLAYSLGAAPKSSARSVASWS